MKLPDRFKFTRKTLSAYLKQNKVIVLPDETSRFLSPEEIISVTDDWLYYVAIAKERTRQVFDKDLDWLPPYIGFAGTDHPARCAFCNSLSGAFIHKTDPLLPHFIPPLHLGCHCRIFAVIHSDLENPQRTITLKDFSLPEMFKASLP